VKRLIRQRSELDNAWIVYKDDTALPDMKFSPIRVLFSLGFLAAAVGIILKQAYPAFVLWVPCFILYLIILKATISTKEHPFCSPHFCALYNDCRADKCSRPFWLYFVLGEV